MKRRTGGREGAGRRPGRAASARNVVVRGGAADVDPRRSELRRPGTAAQERARAFAIDAARWLADDRCEDLLVLDLRGLSGVCDYFVIGTGTSDRQMRAAMEHVEQFARGRGERPYARDGAESAAWMVLDFVDVVVHLFDAAHRQYYELETLWGDAPRVEWSAP